MKKWIKGFNPNEDIPLTAEGTITPTVQAPVMLPVPDAPQIQPPLTPNYDLNQTAVAEVNRRAEMAPIGRAEEDYSKAVAAPVQKQGLGKQILFQALQMVGNLATGQNKPIEFLGNAKKQNKIDQAAKVLAPLQQQEQIKQQGEYNNARTTNIYADNTYQREEHLRKVEDRKSRAQTSRMNAVAGMFKNLPSYDPADPKFAELTKALGDVNLPITPKDAKKKVDLKQDQRTGEWTVILTDPTSGQQEVRSVQKNGQPFKSTPTVVMQGELGLLRQNDQQEWQGQQNQLNRDQQIRLQEIGQQQKIQLETIKAANDAIQKATDANTKAQAEERRRLATETYNNLRNERMQLQNQKLEKELQ